MTKTHLRSAVHPTVPADAKTGPEDVDGVALVRGASRGFTVLVLGGLAAPLGSMVPVVGQYVLVVVAVVAFAAAGTSIGSATRAGVHGALAAAFCYLLVLPLVMFAQGGIQVVQTLGTLALALAVGTLSGVVARRFGFGARR